MRRQRPQPATSSVASKQKLTPPRPEIDRAHAGFSGNRRRRPPACRGDRARGTPRAGFPGLRSAMFAAVSRFPDRIHGGPVALPYPLKQLPRTVAAPISIVNFMTLGARTVPAAYSRVPSPPRGRKPGRSSHLRPTRTPSSSRFTTTSFPVSGLAPAPQTCSRLSWSCRTTGYRDSVHLARGIDPNLLLCRRAPLGWPELSQAQPRTVQRQYWNRPTTTTAEIRGRVLRGGFHPRSIRS
jgi:hypothetical protein